MKNYTVSEISKMLGTSEETIRRWIRSGKLKATQNSRKIGNSVSETDLQKFLRSSPKYASIASVALISSLPIGLPIILSGILAAYLGGSSKDKDALTASDVSASEIIRLLNQELSSHEESATRKKETIAKLQEELAVEERQIASIQGIIKEINAQKIKEG